MLPVQTTYAYDGAQVNFAAKQQIRPGALPLDPVKGGAFEIRFRGLLAGNGAVH